MTVDDMALVGRGSAASIASPRLVVVVEVEVDVVM